MTAGSPSSPAPGTRLRTLAGLVPYACGHTGSCCRTGWPIPIEPAPLELLRRADAAGQLSPLARAPWLNGTILGHTQEDWCSFHDRESRTAGCRLETALGPTALPFSCRQFPRLLLADDRGWHLSLSAWCGTAARLILHGDAQGVEERTFLSIDHIQVDPRVHVEGLDARGAWPPQLRPGVLAGHGAYEAWERRVLAEFLQPVEAGRSRLASQMTAALCWTDAIRAWRAADGDLSVLIQRPWRRLSCDHLLQRAAGDVALRHRVLTPLLAEVPAAWRPPAWPQGLTDTDTTPTPLTRDLAERALARYLATRLMGSWIAYQGEGLRSVLASLVSAYALACLALASAPGQVLTLGHMTSAIRAADWLLLHLLDRDRWAAWCADTERLPDARTLVEIVAEAAVTFDTLPWAQASHLSTAAETGT